jgi:hypothetical protein
VKGRPYGSSNNQVTQTRGRKIPACGRPPISLTVNLSRVVVSDFFEIGSQSIRRARFGGLFRF